VYPLERAVRDENAHTTHKHAVLFWRTFGHSWLAGGPLEAQGVALSMYA
jgi:hypothetical protein